MPIARLARRALRHDGGNVAMIFGLTLSAILGVVGVSVDFARGRSARTTLQNAADAAALAAAKNPDFTTSQAVQIATAYFTTNGKRPIITGPISSTINRTGGADPSVEITLSTTLPASFTQIIGFSTLPVAASSKASLSLSYNTVYALVDMSASMGLAADNSARAKLDALTSPYYAGGCMFGCHTRDGWEPLGKTVYQMAKDNGVELREDVLVSAFAKFVDNYLDPTDPVVVAGRRLMGTYGFSDDATLLQAASNTASTVKTSLTLFPAAKRLNTNFTQSLNTIRSQIGTQGNGTPANPKKTILLVTDGLSWYRPNATAASNGPIDLALCTSVKADGFTLAVIDVKYQDASGEYWFDTMVAPNYPQISTNLKACASSGLYFQATDSDATSLAKVFTDAANALRAPLALTN